jgi:hypothetical protein
LPSPFLPCLPPYSPADRLRDVAASEPTVVPLVEELLEQSVRLFSVAPHPLLRALITRFGSSPSAVHMEKFFELAAKVCLRLPL